MKKHFGFLLVLVLIGCSTSALPTSNVPQNTDKNALTFPPIGVNNPNLTFPPVGISKGTEDTITVKGTILLPVQLAPQVAFSPWHLLSAPAWAATGIEFFDQVMIKPLKGSVSTSEFTNKKVNADGTLQADYTLAGVTSENNQEFWLMSKDEKKVYVGGFLEKISQSDSYEVEISPTETAAILIKISRPELSMTEIHQNASWTDLKNKILEELSQNNAPSMRENVSMKSMATEMAKKIK